MSSVLNQWSDFRVSKNLYKSYFDMQKTNATSAAKEAADKITEKKDSTKTNAYSASKNDKLKTYADNVSSAVSDLANAFKTDAKTGDIDREKAFEAASSFVDSFNELYSSTKGSGNSTVSNKSEFIAKMTSAYSNKLKDVGITVGNDGKLSIDKDTFNSADTGDLDKIFGKKDSFASFMSSQASAVSAYSQTAAYLDAGTTYTKTGAVANSSNASALSGVLYNQLF
jgi:hypothetical protein